MEFPAMNIGASIINYQPFKEGNRVNGSCWVFMLRFHFINLVRDFEG